MMPEGELTQSQAESLIAMEKHRINGDQHRYPDLGGKLTVPLTSADKRENFVLDIARGRIDLLKGKYQNRGRQIVVLLRLDFGGAPHRNPDGEEISCPHIHLYREGYGDKWAVPVPIDKFPKIDDAWETLGHFLDYCNVTVKPQFERGLFT